MHDNAELAAKFLRIVWTAQRAPQQRFAVLATKDALNGDWSDRPLAGAVVPKRLPNIKRHDLYFTPCLFARPRRTNKLALPSRWLYADLDEVDPRTLPLRPTIAIESSPGRYQALWLLNKPLSPDKHARLNQALTYATGADKGGWHASKVLRVPGTLNHKYPERPRVRLLWLDPETRYSPQAIVAHVREHAHEHASAPLSPSEPPELPNTTAAHLRRRYRKRLSRRARKLLTVRTVLPSEDRSSRLWELENLCLDAGLSLPETLILVRSSPYNKYRNQRRELHMLWAEILKAQAKKERAPVQTPAGTAAGAKPTADARKRQPTKKARKARRRARAPQSTPDPNGRSAAHEPDAELADDDTQVADLSPTRLTKYLARDVRPPSWLVEHIWGRSAYGVWAGDYKTYKSTLLMDLAVSVASGRPFLGKFPTHRTGPVLYIQEENSHGFMHDRLHRIVQAKGLGNAVHPQNGKRKTPLLEFGHDLDLHLLNLSGFDLTSHQHLAWLGTWAYENHPALVILDPLYRMAPDVDESKAQDIAPILSSLAKIAKTEDTALILAHHYNKPSQDSGRTRSGHRVSGTGVFNRWWESSVYAERHGDEGDYSIKFHTEHREHGASTAQTAALALASDDPDAYTVRLALADAEQDAKNESEKGSWGDGLDLDKRTDPIRVAEVRAVLKLPRSRDAQKLLKEKGYTFKRYTNRAGTILLRAYPPKR